MKLAENEDEKNCNVEHKFHCESGEFIHWFKYCDFRIDCLDGSDEKYCHRPACDDTEWRCRTNGQCIRSSSRYVIVRKVVQRNTVKPMIRSI